MNRGLRSGLLLLLVVGLVAMTGLEARAQTPKKGGVLKVAVLGDPPTLDSHWTTANFVEVITQHIYESLYTLDQNYQPIPVLAEALPAVSADGLTYTIKLRQGIRFHNGKEMTSEDVVASLKRWGGYAAQAKAMWASVDGVRAVDRSTVEIKLKEKSGIVLISLANANNFAAVYPKEIAEKYPTPAKVTEYIGTGPFKFVEWKPDVHIRMVRYDDHKPRAEAANGYGGRKVAYVDEIRWIPMPAVATRVASLESGEVDFADDIEPNMRAAVGNPLFYRLDSGLAFTEQKAWHSKAGGDAYNQRNKDKAKKLLQEAGYKGEPVRFMTTKEYEWMYNVALVTKQQLEEVGMTIDLQVVDWATLVQRRNNEKMYDIFTTGMTLVPDPTQHPYLRCDWPGWTCDEAITSRMDAIRKEPDPKKRMALWEEVHRVFYERVPVIRYGDLFGLRAMQASVKGYNEKMAFPRFYNVWLDK